MVSVLGLLGLSTACSIIELVDAVIQFYIAACDTRWSGRVRPCHNEALSVSACKSELFGWCQR